MILPEFLVLLGVPSARLVGGRVPCLDYGIIAADALGRVRTKGFIELPYPGGHGAPVAWFGGPCDAVPLLREDGDHVLLLRRQPLDSLDPAFSPPIAHLTIAAHGERIKLPLPSHFVVTLWQYNVFVLFVSN